MKMSDALEQTSIFSMGKMDISKMSIPSSDITSILDQRGSRYGKFVGHAKLSQQLKEVMYETPKWAELAPDQKEALEMIVHKIARILNGDPNYADSWVDIGGYSKLVADRLETGITK